MSCIDCQYDMEYENIAGDAYHKWVALGLVCSFFYSINTKIMGGDKHNWLDSMLIKKKT